MPCRDRHQNKNREHYDLDDVQCIMWTKGSELELYDHEGIKYIAVASNTMKDIYKLIKYSYIQQ